MVVLYCHYVAMICALWQMILCRYVSLGVVCYMIADVLFGCGACCAVTCYVMRMWMWRIDLIC